MLRAICAATVIAITLLPRQAAAQEPRIYVAASGFVSTQDSHRQGMAPSLPRSGVGGTTWGVGGEFGSFVTAHVGVGIEFTLPARIDAVQETDYFRVFQTANRYRDLTLSAVARVRSRPIGPVRIAAVGGAGIVQESSLQRRREAAGSFPYMVPVEFGPYGDEIKTTRWTYGAVVGGESEIALSRHVALVPGMRVQWIRRSDDPGELMWFLGLSSLVLRPSVALRANF